MPLPHPTLARLAHWARSGSISRRLVLIVGLLGAFALLASALLRMEDEGHLAEISRSTTTERQRLVSALVVADASRPRAWIDAHASRPELRAWLRAPNAKRRKALVSALRTGARAANVAAVSVYGADGRRRFTVGGSSALRRWDPLAGRARGPVPAAFFGRMRAGYVSVLTAPIMSGGRRVGTLAVVRPWTRNALDRIGRLTGTRVEIVSRTERNARAVAMGEDRFNWFEELRGVKGSPIAYRHFSANSMVVAQYRLSVLRTQTFVVLLVAGFLAVLGAFLGRFVGLPLRQMRQAVEAGTTERIQHLIEDTTEIGEQARVIEDWITVRAELLNSNEWLEREVRERMRELNDAYTSTIRSLVVAMEYRDQETKGHCERVTEMAETLGRALRLSEIEIDDLRRGALLHDIGKIAIPDTVLLKPGALTPDERTLMETHAEIGYQMLRKIRFLERALDIPRYHHEKWDGTGYPNRIEGNDIPLAARIFSLVDVWDALSSTRPYRKAWPPDQVKAHIVGLSGTHFDPTVVAAFERLSLDLFPTEYRPTVSLDDLDDLAA